jgi:phosphotransferase system HPr (HPr) family protein
MQNNNKELTLSAPLSGPVLTLAKVPDPVFASGAMGDGIAIDPLNDTLHAPCAGLVVHVARTGHAITLRADNGAELLLHLGLDTVELQGEGFSMLVKEGARVSNGQPLLRYDLDKVAQQCKSLVSLMILTNSGDFQARPITLKSVKVGEPLLHIIRRQACGAQVETDASGIEVNGHVQVAFRGGLHARPAALIRQTAQGFKSKSQLHFGGKSATCDSLIGLMALAVGEQDEVQVSCRGVDAEAALQSLLTALSTALAEDSHAAAPTPIAQRNRPAEAGVLHGVCAAPGLVGGPLFRLHAISLPVDAGGHDSEQQQDALDTALILVRSEIEHTLAQAKKHKNTDEEAIFAAHLALLEDPALLDAANTAIVQGAAATHAWSQSIDAQCEVLQQLGSPLLAERANDLRDLKQRVLRALLGEAWQYDVPAGAIVAAHELTPSDLLQLSQQGVAGLCMAEGGATSHVAILARGKGLPCMVALGSTLLNLEQGQSVVLDADGARLELAPTAERLADVRQAQLDHQQRRAFQQSQAHTRALTLDGLHIEVAANVASSTEAADALANGADGVGLLRTEFLFVDRNTAPDEQEQRLAYQAVLDAMGDKVVVAENERAGAYIKALGGAQNLITVGACTTRLRLDMVDRNKANDAELKALGAMAVVRPGKGGSLQVVVGPMADSIADEIRLAMPALGRAIVSSPAAVIDAPKPAAVATSEAQQWLNALGGGENVLQMDCIAMTRIRLQLADGKALSECDLKALGCQGVSQLEGGVWHLLIGDKASSLGDALEVLVNRSEVSAKV